METTGSLAAKREKKPSDSDSDNGAEPEDPVKRTAPSPKRSRPKVGRWFRRALGLAFVLAVIALLVFAWLPKPVAVEASIAERGELRVTVDEDGRTRVKERHIVSAPLGGNLARIELDPGDEIERGAPLARLVPLSSPLLDPRSRQTAEARVAAARAARRQALAQVERAKAALAFATKEAERQKKLLAERVGTEQARDRAEVEVKTVTAEVASAEFGARVAAYELEMARAALGHLSNKDPGAADQMIVPSPIDGVVLKVIQQSEGVVQPGTPLLEVGNPAALEIVVDLLTSDAVDVQPGAVVLIDRWGGEQLTGRVRLVEPSAFTRISSLGVEEQRVNAVIDLQSPRKQWKALGDGYRVEVHIVVWQGQDVLSVPASAVFRHEGGWAVFGVDEGVARLRPVEIGRRSGLRAEVVEGLGAGDRVITHPSDRVRDGVDVKAR